VEERCRISGIASKVVASSTSIEAFAHQAGFDLCGFARPEPIPPEVLTRWLEAGMAADMDWMAKRMADRLDVKRLLPKAQTVVALACNYYRDDPGTERSPIALYARGRDYHATLQDRMRHLRRFLREAYGAELPMYNGIDHGPFMEKVWAARAGIGYVAKNGCLITPRFGSYVNLAVLVLGVSVDRYAGGPATDRCGSCDLCIRGCPTQAIDLERRVDARECLSYQTIENAGSVPEPLRAAFEETVFGCDICQRICPLNDAPLTADARFAPRAVAQLGVRELAALSREQYAALIPGTPLARAKYDGLRRNAAYALGALRDTEARPILQLLEGDPCDLVREAARWALGRLDGAMIN
jgi:epoxyqueuosine reductase